MRLVMTLAAACLLLNVAWAEDASDSLGEVVVTATRRAEPLKDYAGSLTRLEGGDIAQVGATHHAEIMNRAPGVMFQRNSGQESLTAIRSPVLTGPGSCGSFLFLENSIPVRPVGFCNVNELFELDTEQAHAIEIGRGPASALYGSGAMHGSVNVLDATPAQLPELGAGLEVGPSQYYRAKGAVSSLGEKTDVGLTGLGEYDGGWRDHSTTKQQKFVGTLEHRFDGATASLTLAANNLNQETAGFITGYDAYLNPAVARTNANPEAFRDAHSLRLMGHLDVPLSPEMNLDVRPYLRHSGMNFLQHFLVGKPLETNGQDSGGVLLSVDRSWAGGRHAIAGTDLEMSNGKLVEYQPNVATDGTPAANAIRPKGYHYNYNVHALVGAVYGQLEQPFLEHFKATVGVRGETVHYDYDNHMIAGNTRDNGTTCGAAGCLYARPADRKDSFATFTPKFSVSYEYQPLQVLYASATRGFRAPDTNELYRLQRQQNVASLGSERIDSLELGLRGVVAEVHYTVAGFTMLKQNVIFRDSLGFNVDNARTRHRGVEYEFSYAPARQLSLVLDGTYAKHTYDFSRNADGGEIIVSGRDIDTAPRHINNARVEWRPVTPASLELEWQHVGSYSVDAANLHFYSGHDVLNLRGAWALSPAWRVAARLDNLTDRAYADRGDYAFGTYRYFPGRPRTLFLEVAYHKDH